MNTVTCLQDYAITKHTLSVITQFSKFHGLQKLPTAVAQTTDSTLIFMEAIPLCLLLNKPYLFSPTYHKFI